MHIFTLKQSQALRHFIYQRALFVASNYEKVVHHYLKTLRLEEQNLTLNHAIEFYFLS